MSLIKDYFEKTKEYKKEYGEKTIVFMQCGSFFEVYALLVNEKYEGSNIQDFGAICDLNIVEKKVIIEEKQVVMAGFKEVYWEKYTKKMQDYGYSVVIFTQDEACANTTRSLFGIFSPGSFFSESVDEVSNFSCCIWIQLMNTNKLNPFSMYIGVSFVDIITGQSYVYEFKETYIHTPSAFDQVEKIISTFCPSETILVSSFKPKEAQEIVQFIHLSSKLIHFIYLSNMDANNDNNKNNNNTQRALKCEKQVYQKEILVKYFTIIEFQVFFEPFLENPIGCQSYCFLLDFLYQHNPYLVNKLTQPQFYKNKERLFMGNHSLKQLNIIDNENKSSKYSCIINLLNDCVTNMGKRKFKYDFLNPTTNSEMLHTEYDMIDYLCNNNSISNSSNTNKDNNTNNKSDNKNEEMENKLQKIFDISRLKRQIVLKRISPKNIYQLYTSMKNTITIIEMIKEDTTWITYLNKKLEFDFLSLSQEVSKIIVFIEKHIMIESCKTIDSFQKFEDNFIVFGVDKELDKYVSLLKNKELELALIKNFLNELLVQADKSKKKDKDIELIKLHETEKNNISLLITEKRSTLLQQQIKSSYQSQNQQSHKVDFVCALTGENKTLSISTNVDDYIFPRHTSSNKFIHSRQILDICKEITTLKLNVMESITKAYNTIVQKLEEFDKEFHLMECFIVSMDVILCKQKLVHKYKLSKPVIDTTSSNSFLKINGVRHILIEAISQNELYVPNDVNLGDYDTRGILLYGTNAVGKTSFIKSIGITIVMAQAGLFVPCANLEFKPYASLFTRLLGCDNLFKGLSTFAVEMTELRSILKYADNNSLVLGDELCAGTESTSAKSIFVAGVNKLYHKQCSFIFATHLHEIVHYEEIISLDKLQLKHMEVIFNREKNRLEYNRKIQDGPGESIYGLEVCKSLDLPMDFLEDANRIRLKYNPESNSILDQKSSAYNVNKIKGKCELCKIHMAQEVHHLIPQKEFEDKVATINQYTLKKNNLANLYNLCESCHLSIHREGSYHKIIKTTEGFELSKV